ncbi:CinA family nicotinamide mononucleotide deamidase-related protein [Thalassotalea maritima]|uniref:CinA family nicotinamide mononucleotide deamidase-related protein n=1 Tax=Thalassotalea maritima TaxID=3242416 RepID=UPI003527145E
MLNVQLLLTGNELMSGDIVDTNSAYLAQQLKDIGIELHCKTTVGDSLPLLIEMMQQLSRSADVLIVNGGLGPTVDDMTAQALSDVSARPLTIHPLALEHVKQWCLKRHYTLTGPNIKQALLPLDCDLVTNSIGSAPGFKLTHNNCLIICTPGVPSELKTMFADQIKPLLQTMLPDALNVVTDKMHVFGIGESGLQKMINEQLPEWPEQIELGFRASMPILEVKVTSRFKQDDELRQQWGSKLNTLLGQHVVNHNGDTLGKTLIHALAERNLKVTTAESCTGGLIASLLTQVPGSSAVFEAGFVTYSNAMKQQLLDVDAATLQQCGAVSQAVVEQMLHGALTVSGADYGVAVSGIAGPDGGTEDKPVGTVWLAWGSKNDIRAVKLFFPAGRQYFQRYVASAGLDLLRRMILGFNDQPRYISERQPLSVK